MTKGQATRVGPRHDNHSEDKNRISRWEDSEGDVELRQPRPLTVHTTISIKGGRYVDGQDTGTGFLDTSKRGSCPLAPLQLPQSVARKQHCARRSPFRR